MFLDHIQQLLGTRLVSLGAAFMNMLWMLLLHELLTLNSSIQLRCTTEHMQSRHTAGGFSLWSTCRTCAWQLPLCVRSCWESWPGNNLLHAAADEVPGFRLSS